MAGRASLFDSVIPRKMCVLAQGSSPPSHPRHTLSVLTEERGKGARGDKSLS